MRLIICLQVALASFWLLKNETVYLAIFCPLLFPLFSNRDYFECLLFIDSWYFRITLVRLEVFPFLIITESLASLLLPNMEIMTGLGRSCRALKAQRKKQQKVFIVRIGLEVTFKIIWFSTGRGPSSWPGYPEPLSSLALWYQHR